MAINYLIHLPDGRRLLYALDTGWFPEETWAFLEHRSTDILILDCTFGARSDRSTYPDGHLDVLSFVKTLERMKKMQCIDKRSSVFATHINPHQGDFHHELQQRFNATAFDVHCGV